MRKNYFNRKSVEGQPCTSLETILNGLCFCTVERILCISGVFPSGVAKLNWAILTTLIMIVITLCWREGSFIYYGKIEGGMTRFPKYMFWAQFPIGLHLIL